MREKWAPAPDELFTPAGLQMQGSQNRVSRQTKPCLWELALPSKQAFPTHGEGTLLGSLMGISE